MAGIGFSVISALFFLWIITFAKPYVPHCPECHFTEWDALTAPSNQGGFFITGLLALIGAASIVAYKVDRRAKAFVRK
jgi:hypothetical protein